MSEMRREVRYMAQERIKIAPELTAYVDDDHTMLTMEVAIPGVPKDQINLKMHEDSFSLSAPMEDMEYTTAFSFCCPVKPDAAKAKYENGLLKIEVPFKDPMEDAVKVKVE
jgi:HSP20 family molecular chaperone IbpA